MACCLLLLPLAGSVPSPDPHNRAKSLIASGQPRSAQWTSLRSELDQGNRLFQSSQYLKAKVIFRHVFEAARSAHLLDLAARAAGNTGSCDFALHQYQTALDSFLNARRLAVQVRDWNETAALDTNIASLYSERGDLDTAASWMQGALERLSGDDRERHLPEILIQLAILRARQNRMPEALTLFRRGIDGADRSGNINLYTIGWNRVGEEYLKGGDLRPAESAFLEAFRVRKLNHLSLDSSYRNLGRLRMLQGDLVSASHLFDRYVELAESQQGVMPAWDVYHCRGRVRLAEGRLLEALHDLRIAVRLARAWRWSGPASDAGRVGAEGMLDQVYAALIEAGNRLYLRTHDPALVRETFEAAEENRASSLRALVSGPRTPSDFSPAYGEALLRLQRAEVQALRIPQPAALDAVSAARAELARLDSPVATSTPAVDSRGPLYLRVQRALGGDAALFSFQLGESMSWMWALDRSTLALYPLPPRRQIEERARAATEAIRQDLPAAGESGAALYRTLFGMLAPRFQRKKHWLLALDQGEHSIQMYRSDSASLFELPFAALPIKSAGKTVFMAESHSTLIVPGAGYFADSMTPRNSPALAPIFVGVGDAIYNTADPRLPAVHKRPATAPPFTAFAATGLPSLALPRLVASASELDACARAWNGEQVLLKGAQASRVTIQQQLRRNPAVLHFATHVLSSSAGTASGLIALSLNPAGETELLSPAEIARWHIHAGLVVLSGCNSAQGGVLPGTGILGLTRAWLAAGALNVIGSRWTTPDESGALFTALYCRLRTQAHPAAAEALRTAQVEMIRAGGWRARPRYWAAYTVVGRQ